MPAHSSYDYALIRVVPRVERQEFVNAGVIAWCREHELLEARIAGGADAGPIGRLTRRERFDWLVAPRSTMIQTSAVHSGRSDDMAATLEHLLATMVR